MSATYNLTTTATLFHADMREALRALPDCCIDSCVTDPPYHLTSVVKRFGAENAAPAQFGSDGAYSRASAGFMGKVWDGGDIAFQVETWREVWRVLKPGGFVAAFGASRGYHRMACAIEDAGFEVRDSLMWVYGTGFPKSHNVSLSIDKESGAIGHLAKSFNMKGGGDRAGEFQVNGRDISIRHEPSTPEAAEWEGWGTALKPAFEPIVLARKPLSERTVAANVLRWRTGAINIDGCRVECEGGSPSAKMRAAVREGRGTAPGRSGNYTHTIEDRTSPETFAKARPGEEIGRFPANVVHDGSDEVVGAFPSAPGQLVDVSSTAPSARTKHVYGKMSRAGEPSAERRYTERGSTNFAATPGARRGDSGSAARFFYSAKASKADRAGSKHPTVKPVSLIQWLARLITPPGGVVLDPFAGSGTTAVAATLEGFKVVLCEREAEYVDDIRRRFESPGIAPTVHETVDSKQCAE